jgi:glycosyltransferase involved in cell wall biosynthesis
MYSAAVAHDKELRARIVLNHPALYERPTVQEARTLWNQQPKPAPPGAPLVSVIIPTFNRPGQLEEALGSVLGQTLQDFEVIVVNDNGLDVEHVIDRLNGRRQIVYLRRTGRKGISHARNQGLRFARGKYIAHLDDDDVFYPDHLETLAGFLEKTGHKAAYADALRAEVKTEEGREVVQKTVAYSNDWDNDSILVSNLAPTLCFLHERALGLAAGEFDESLTTHEDWDYWIRLSRLCRPVHIKKVTCEFRVAGDGSSITSRSRDDFLRTAKIIYSRYRDYASDKEVVCRAREQVLRVLRAELGVQESRLEAMLRWWREWRSRGKRG